MTTLSDLEKKLLECRLAGATDDTEVRIEDTRTGEFEIDYMEREYSTPMKGQILIYTDL